MESGLRLPSRSDLSSGFSFSSITTYLCVALPIRPFLLSEADYCKNGIVCAHVQSLISQGSQFPLRKPAGFHYDFALLGLTTFLAGLLGVPAPNGLIPQAPIHTRSLLVHELVRKDKGAVLYNGDGDGELREMPVAVVEQRVSNLAQGSLCLVLLTKPFLHVLNLVPQGARCDPFLYFISKVCSLHPPCVRRARRLVVRVSAVGLSRVRS
jgi:HCO3- transporter integral membrane domain